MYQDSDGTLIVEVAPVGTSIRAGTDTLMALIEHERKLAAQAAQSSLYHLRLYVEEYKRCSQINQHNDAQKLAESQRRYSELGIQFLELQNVKRADDALLRKLSTRVESLQQERDYLRSEMPATLKESKVHPQQDASPAASPDTYLADFGIFHLGHDSLCFGSQWACLWNEFSCGSSQGLSPSDSLTPAELGTLLQNVVDQVRHDKHTIRSLNATISSFGQEDAYIPQACREKDFKSPEYFSPLPHISKISHRIPTVIEQSAGLPDVNHTENTGHSDPIISQLKAEHSHLFPSRYVQPFGHNGYDLPPLDFLKAQFT